MKYLAALFSLFVLLGLVITDVNAHGTATSAQKEVDSYIVEFEYDATDIVEGSTTPFVFRLLDKKTKNPVRFDSILVRVENEADQSTQFVVRLVEDELQEGSARLTTMFDDGTYNFTLTFFEGGEKVASTDFGIEVRPDESEKEFPGLPVASFVIGSVLGFFAAKLLTRTSKE